MKKGFTLVELISVITILAIIMVIAIPRVANVMFRTQDDIYKIDEKKMISAAKSYNADAALTGTVQLSELVSKGFISEIIDPKDNDTVCTGYVEITKDENNKFVYTPHLICGNNYETP